MAAGEAVYGIVVLSAADMLRLAQCFGTGMGQCVAEDTARGMWSQTRL